jgi:hypothetical protein
MNGAAGLLLVKLDTGGGYLEGHKKLRDFCGDSTEVKKLFLQAVSSWEMEMEGDAFCGGFFLDTC